MLGLALGLGVVLAAAPTTTELPVAIEYEAPVSCMERDAFVGDVERLSGARVADGPRTISVRLHQVDGGFELALTRVAADGTTVESRTIEDEDCDTLAHAAALVVAVNEEPVATSRRVVLPEPIDTDPAPHNEPAPPNTPEPRFETPEPEAAPERERRLWSDLLVHGGLAIGLTPRPTGAAGGGLRLGGERFDVELSASHAFATETQLASGIGIRAASTSAVLLAAWHHDVGSFEVRLGLGARVGSFHGAGTGRRVVAQSTRGVWWGIPLVAGATWPAQSRIALHTEVEAIAMVLRPAIGLLTPTGELGPAVRLGRGAVSITLGPRLRVF